MADLDVKDAPVGEESEDDGEVLDLEGRGLNCIMLPDHCCSYQTLILNNNDLTKLDGLDACLGLLQLSAANNHIVHMIGLNRLTSLTVLSLSNNSIGTIEGLEGLTQLQWLDLSSNSIKIIEHLPAGGKLHYLDLSDNDITYISDLSMMNNLKTLLLHSNNISSLKTAATGLPQNLGVLSLADNSIYDLNEISHLSGLHSLQQLSLSENPCVLKAPNCQAFDYRPFVWNWCPSIQILDALIITEKERLLGEWLYSQGKGRHFQIGEHMQLVEYLASTCPLLSSEQVQLEGDSKLNQILNQQRQYQKQLQQQHWYPGGDTCAGLQSKSQHIEHLKETSSTLEVKATVASHVNESNKLLQTRHAWAKSSDLSVLPHANFQPHAVHAHDLTLQDVTQDFDTRSSVSLLESESVYLPFDVPSSPVVLRRTFATQEKQPQDTDKLSFSAAAEKSHIPITIQSQPFVSNREIRHDSLEQKAAQKYDPLEQKSAQKYNSSEQKSFQKCDSLEQKSAQKSDSLKQRSVPPLNQHMSRISPQRSALNIVLPVSSSSEPVVSIHKDSTLPTARSQDYESGSENTANESDSLTKKWLDIRPKQHHHSVTASMDDSSKAFPQDKLNHIKTVAGSKKAASHSHSRGQHKTAAASRIKDGVHHIKTSSNPATTNTSTSVSVSSPAKSLMFKADSPAADNNITKTSIPEVIMPDLPREKNKLEKGEYVGVDDSKLMKSKLNQERLEQRRVASHGDNKAAMTIQACWRGYRAREHNPQVISIRKEIRARRAEDHIILLRQELDRNRRLYEEEKQLRILQMEAIRLLYKEVQEMKSCSHASSKDLNIANCFSSTSTMTTCNSPSVAEVTYKDVSRTQELERTCASLQNQVTQLQQALESVSSVVFRTNSLEGADLEFTDLTDRVLVTPISDEQFILGFQSDEASHWGCIPHSLSPYPSEEEDIYYLQVSTVGAPTPPRHLQLQHHSQEALLLSWQPSSCCNEGWEEEGNKHIIGYRVYVNDHVKAFVCQKTSVLVEGLNPSTIYKFYVKALSGFGESFQSNTIMAKLAKGQERHKISTTSGTDSTPDSDKDTDSMKKNEKLRCKNKKPRKSPRSSEKTRGMKVASLHRRHEEETMCELDEQTSEIININNNSLLNKETFAIFTHPKLHTHHRHHQKKHSDGSTDCPSETSQESSPCAGTHATGGGNKNSMPNPEVSFISPPLLAGSSRSRRSLGFSQTEAEIRDNSLATGRKDNFTPPGENSGPRGNKPSSQKSNSPSSESSKQGSPLLQDISDNARIKYSQVSPSCDSENKDKQKASPQDGVRISPPVGTEARSGSQSSSFSETFTVDKAHSYLESVSAIAESALGKQVSRSHRRTRSKDYYQQQEDMTHTNVGSRASPEQVQDILSVEEAARLGIGRNRDKETHRETEAAVLSGNVKGHRRSHSKGQLEWKRDDTSEGVEKKKEDKAENKTHNKADASSKTVDATGLSHVSEIGSISLSSQPVIDGRRRHSSGSRPSSPVVMTGLGERSRLTVAEFMMEQKFKGIMKSASSNTVAGHTEDVGSRPETSGSGGDNSQCTVSSVSHAIVEGDGSRRTNITENIINSLVETSKRSHSNESLPGSVRTDTSRVSPSNESLSEGTHEELANYTGKNPADQPSVAQNQASGCRRSHSMGSYRDLVHKENKDSHSLKTNLVVSKILQKLENFTRKSTNSVKESKSGLKLKKSDSDERDSDAATSKPPSDDERRSGMRSRNLSDSDMEVRALDIGNQMPPQAPTDVASGSHSDDSHHSHRGHRRTPSDQRPSESHRPAHSPIIMEGGAMRKTSSSVRRNQSFHGLLPSKHQDSKASPSFGEEVSPKADEHLSQSDSPVLPHVRSRSPSPARGKKSTLSPAQIKYLADSSKPGLDYGK